MTKQKAITFKQFKAYFPEIDLPITLSEDTHREFSRHNKPFNQSAIEIYLKPNSEFDSEFTEYVPCFKIKETEKFDAIVYWIGSLLDYQYVMVTFDKKGKVIDKATLAGTKVIENALLRSVATIDEEWIIYIVAGETDAQTDSFDASKSKSFSLELLASGEIIASK